MDSFHSMAEGMAGVAAYLGASSSLAPSPIPKLKLTRLDDLETVVVSKATAGFSPADIDSLRHLVADAGAGLLGKLKFLVFDFAHAGEAGPAGEAAFDSLIAEVADLIMQAPIVAVAYARGTLAGADLEFALACSMILAQDDAAFSFAADPTAALGTYAFLAQKLGFVRAERLMEAGEVIGARQMQELLLVKSLLPKSEGLEALGVYLQAAGKRHNAASAIYRAQRIASPALPPRTGPFAA